MESLLATAGNTTRNSGYPLVLTGHRSYGYSEDLDAVSPADLYCHMLLVDDGSRHRSYYLLLLSHVDEVDLREEAA